MDMRLLVGMNFCSCTIAKYNSMKYIGEAIGRACIDLLEGEGRINRYKGHAVCKNLVLWHWQQAFQS